MKIGIYDPYLDTMSGGEKYMLSTAQSLAKAHQVSLFWDPSKKIEIIEKAKKRFNTDISSIPFVPSLFSDEVTFVERLLASKRYDLIILLSDGSIPFLSCPLIVHFQSPVEWVSVSLKTKMKLSRIKKVVCNSQFTKSYIDKKFGVTSRVVYPPVSLPVKSNGAKTKTILNVGRYGINHTGSSYKKQEVLLQAFIQMVHSGQKDWELVLLMSIKEEDAGKLIELQENAKGYPVRFVINPESNVLWQEYSQASIYWHASGFGEDLVTHPDRAEHFGISTVEAMGMGAVPIVINAGGQKEIVVQGQTGFLWNATEELLSFTQEMIINPTKREALAKNAIQAAQQFSLDRFSKEWEQIV